VNRRIQLACLVALIVVATLSNHASAQDIPPDFRQYDNYDRYQYLPRVPEGPENPDPFPLRPRPATGDPEVLVEEWKGLVVLGDPSQVVENPGDVSGVEVYAGPDAYLLHSSCFYELANSYLGGPISMLRLNELVRDVILFYRDNDQPVVDVSVPAGQDITDGVVQIVVTEARLGRVLVQGTRFFDPCMLLDQLYFCSGSPIYESHLLAEQRWLYRNPYRIVDIELTPGEAVGETDVIFNVQDKRPIRFYAGYEDTGTQATGLERTIYGINWYNAFGRDDQVGYQYTASSDFNALSAHSAFYSTALPNRDILTLYASHADFRAPIPGFLFANEGDIWQILLRWYRELSPIGCYEHGLTAGFDFKRTNTGLVFGGFPVFEGHGDIDQFMVGYHGKRFDCSGSWHLGADLYVSPGGLSQFNNDADFETIRPFATADYIYTRQYLERRWWLPRHLEFMARITGQLADGNLLPTEQLGLGGYNSVRGYDLQSVLGDSGYFVNLELRTQPVSLGLGGRWGLSDEFGILDDQLTARVFYDFGSAYDHTSVPLLDPSVDLQSVGVGFDYALQRRFSLRVDYGWQLTQLELPGVFAQPAQRIHIGAVVSH
jgi:hemolysin activation/secretion protein